MSKLSRIALVLFLCLSGVAYGAEGDDGAGGGTGGGDTEKPVVPQISGIESLPNKETNDGGSSHSAAAKVDQNINEVKDKLNTTINQVNNNTVAIDKIGSTVKGVQDSISQVQSTVSTVQGQVSGIINSVSQAEKNASEANSKSQTALDTAARAEEDVRNYKSDTDSKISVVENKAENASKAAETAVNTAQHAEDVAGIANDTAKNALSKVEGAVAESKAYTDSKFKQFGEEIEKTKKFAAAGTASALAASQIPQVSQGSAFSLGVGMGNYSGQSALAVGMSARMGDYTVTKLTFTTDSMSNVGAGVGIAVEW